jgi:hypothetical protein
MIEKRKPGLVEHAYGLPEKASERLKLPTIFPLRERALVYTHEWLSPVLFRFDEKTGTMLILDVLPPAAYTSYTIDAVGGVRIKKSVELGIIYVNMRPTYVDVDETYTGLVRERLRASLNLSRLRVRVRDPKRLLLTMWRRHGGLAIDDLVHEVRQAFRKIAEKLTPELGIEDLLTKPSAVQEKVSEAIEAVIGEYGVELVDLELRPVVDNETYEYYFWHIVNDIPPEFVYLSKLLKRLPQTVYDKAPTAVSIIVAAVLARKLPRIVELAMTMAGEAASEQESERRGERR